MLRIIITILMCATFLTLGLLGEAMRNCFNYSLKIPLPPPTILCMVTFPLNAGRFLESTLSFCLAVIIILLASLQSPPLIKKERFTEYSLIIFLLFAVYFGFFVISLLLPLHLLNDRNVGSQSGKSFCYSCKLCSLRYGFNPFDTRSAKEIFEKIGYHRKLILRQAQDDGRGKGTTVIDWLPAHSNWFPNK